MTAGSFDIAHQRALDSVLAGAADVPLAALDWAYGTFGAQVTIASSFSIEDIVVIALACRAAAAHGVRPHVFMLDTGRLHQETHDAAAALMDRLDFDLAVFAPNHAPLEAFATEFGPNPFYRSPELRHGCCGLRKVEPLGRALAGRALWVTGLRRAQAATRRDLAHLEWDGGHGLYKLNPLLELSEGAVRAAIQQQELPIIRCRTKGLDRSVVRHVHAPLAPRTIFGRAGGGGKSPSIASVACTCGQAPKPDRTVWPNGHPV